jgi:hypothetical protein
MDTYLEVVKFLRTSVTHPVDCFSLVTWNIFISILICASLCRDMYPMIYTYPDFRVLGFLGLKDMHMHLELFQVFLGSHWPKYTKWQQKGRATTIFFFGWSLSLIVWWWSLTKLSVALGCFTFDFLHFSCSSFYGCCVSCWWMQGLWFFFFSFFGWQMAQRFLFFVLWVTCCVLHSCQIWSSEPILRIINYSTLAIN